MDLKAEIVTIPDQMALKRRETGKYNIIPNLLGELFQQAMANSYPIGGPPGFICHEKGQEEASKADVEGTADVEVFLPMQRKIEDLPDGFVCELHKRGKCVKVVYKGAYEGMAPTYAALVKWIADKKLTVAGNWFEVYLTDPREVGMENNITEIIVPIE